MTVESAEDMIGFCNALSRGIVFSSAVLKALFRVCIRKQATY